VRVCIAVAPEANATGCQRAVVFRKCKARSGRTWPDAYVHRSSLPLSRVTPDADMCQAIETEESGYR
jgi:hypothetical protein